MAWLLEMFCSVLLKVFLNKTVDDLTSKEIILKTKLVPGIAWEVIKHYDSATAFYGITYNVFNERFW